MRCIRGYCQVAALIWFVAVSAETAAGQLMTKPQVANLIMKVENGVDEFRDYLERRGDNARDTAAAAPAEGRRGRRGKASESQKVAAEERKDELEDALEDLNRTTNRLRRKFDATDTWMETKVEVERVMDNAREINQVLARGNYGAEAARLWAVLRAGINDLARAYGIQPMAF